MTHTGSHEGNVSIPQIVPDSLHIGLHRNPALVCTI